MSNFYFKTLLWGCALALVLILAGCTEILAPTKTPEPPKVPATRLQIEKLEAFNISENMSSFSTQNDEILLLIYLMEKKQDGHVEILEEKVFGELVFDSLTAVHNLNLTFVPANELKNNMISTFVLVELDNDGTIPKIQELYRAELANGDFLIKTDHIKLDSIIGDDDFLGLKFLEFKDLSRGEDYELTIKGMHLFDIYKYTLTCRGL